MKISQFYKEKKCPKLLRMEQFAGRNERRLHLKKVLDMVVGLIGANTSYSDIRHTVSASIAETYAKLSFDFPWQRELYVKQDYVLFDRLFKWFEKYEYSVVKPFNAVSVTFENHTFSDGTNELRSMVPLIMRDPDGKFYGMIIHTGKSTRSKGYSVKKMSSSASCDLYASVAKYALESSYPNIEICSIYLSLGSDTTEEMAEEFVEADTMATNVHRLNYEDVYEDGIFQKDVFLKKMLVIVTDAGELEDCSTCRVADVCNIPKLHSCYEEKEKAGGYSLPGNFTEEQEAVVEHVEGAMRVCAGPGSGKTTTLVGRVRYLMEEKGISPEFILVVSFTAKAAEELRERCLTFLSESELPKICTLHSLGFDILKSCKNLFDRPLVLLSVEGKYRLIENMVTTRPQLQGFKYGMLKGAHGLYKTISDRMEFYKNCLKNENESGFFEKYPEVGEDFIQFIMEYDACLKEQGYISFDDMITMCNELFKEHPEILNVYQNVYKYIMVDEFQDVNADQANMVYTLAEKHHNLVIVGDDDQSIYSWRGGSSSFMLDFHKAFPETKDVVFTKNFRSSGAIVKAARELIEHKQRRIAKDIVSGSNKDVDTPPTVIYSTSTNVIESLIVELVNSGYGYRDIAVLSCNNKVLDRLHKELKVPTLLSKSYLHQDAFFMLLRCVLSLKKDLNDDNAFYQFLRLYGHDYAERASGLSLSESLFAKYGISLEELGRIEDNPYYEVLSTLRDYLKILSKEKNCYSFIVTLQKVCGWQNSDSPAVIKEQAEYRGVNTFDSLLEYLNALSEFGSDSRVAEERGDKVLLITSYDAKGKEYKIALVVNDFYRDNMDECRNLFYVAITRAEEGVFIFQSKEIPKSKKDKFVDYLPDMCHVVKEITV